MSGRSIALTVILVAFVVGAGLATYQSSRVSAHAPHPGLNFWISVSGVPGCDTKNGDSSCHIAPGSTFVVGVYLDALPSDLPQYGGYEAQLDYTGVTPNHDARSNSWPDCVIPVSSYDTPNRVALGCAKGVPPAPSSSYTGLIGTNSFVCTQSGAIALAHGVDKTDVIDDSFQLHAEDPNTSETLTMNCSQGGPVAPTPTPGAFRGATGFPSLDSTVEPTATAKATSAAQSRATFSTTANPTRTAGTPAGSGAAGGQSSGSGGRTTAWLIAVTVVVGLAVAGAAGAIGRRALRNRRGTGPQS